MGFRGQVSRLSELVADSLTGAVIKTAVAGARIELNTAASNVARFFSGDAAEIDPSTLSSYASSGEAGIELRSASVDTGGGTPSARAHLLLAADTVNGTRLFAQAAGMELLADNTVSVAATLVDIAGALNVAGNVNVGYQPHSPAFLAGFGNAGEGVVLSKLPGHTICSYYFTRTGAAGSGPVFAVPDDYRPRKTARGMGSRTSHATINVEVSTGAGTSTFNTSASMSTGELCYGTLMWQRF